MRKMTAVGLALSLGILPCAPAAFGQQAHPKTTAAVNTGATAASPAKTATAAPPLPAPSAKESARAREFFRKGTDALRAHKSTRALKMFAAARKLDPANGSYLVAYEIARQQQIGGMIEEANTDHNNGKSAAAKQRLLAALQVDAGNPFVQEHLQSLAAEDAPAVEGTMPMPQFSSGLVELAPRPVRATFHLRGQMQKLIQQIFRAYGVTPILDDSVPTKNVSIDLSNATFAEASIAVRLATGTFIVPLDPQHALVAKDTAENRRKFERLLLETVFLPGVDSRDMSQAAIMIRTVFDVRQVAVRPETGTMSIRAPEAVLRAINATLARLYLDRPEVILDVRVYQINSSFQQNLGVSFPQTLNVFDLNSELSSIISQNQSTIAQLIASGLVNPGDLAAIAALLVGMGLANGSVLSQPFAMFGNGLTLSGLSFGGTTVNASLNISKTRQLDHIQLRAADSQAQSFLIGSRYPFVTQSYSAGTQTPTSFTSISTLLTGSGQSNASSNPLAYAPTVEYADLGLTMKATPHVLQNNEVQIKLQIKIAALAGASLNQSPIINNRSFTTTIQVHDSGSALITGNVSRSEARSLSGIPGLSELPGFAWTASPVTNVTIGKLLIVISPHIVSATHSSVASQMMPVPPNRASFF